MQELANQSAQQTIREGGCINHFFANDMTLWHLAFGIEASISLPRLHIKFTYLICTVYGHVTLACPKPTVCRSVLNG